jgi:CHAD domain-containing protein
MPSHSVAERELKFDVPADFAVPDLRASLSDGARVEERTEQLHSDYYDTAEHDLLNAGITLRRRTGSTDVGWQLKVPMEDFREEIRLPLGSGDAVPAELAALLTGIRRGRDLVHVARLSTQRRVVALLDSDGRRLVEIDDDTVRAAAAGATTAVLTTWREVEVELGSGEEDLLDELAHSLRRAGAKRSPHPSKLERALGPERPDRRRRKPGARPVAEYLADQQRALLAGDLSLRRGDQHAVHRTRVAARRLRSTLRTFRDAAGADQADQRLYEELKWYAGLLGAVRDPQVQESLMLTLLEDVSAELRVGPVQERINDELGRRRSAAWDELTVALDGPRYLALLDQLDERVQLGSGPAGKPRTDPASVVRATRRKARRRLRAALASNEPEQLHRARKAAKRARYAVEAAAPVLGRGKAATLVRRYKRVQDVLGDYQDTVVGRELLHHLGASASSRRNSFTFGVLYEREARRGEQAVRTACKIAEKV